MRVAGHWSLEQVAKHSKGYSLLVRRLCEHNKIKLVKRLRFTYIAEADVPEVVWLVDQWRRRPRMASPHRAPSRVKIEQVVLAAAE